jgi:hypothetical protein
MITYTADFDNHISQDSYDKTIYSISFHQLTCTCGHSACLTIHGYYDRSVKSGERSIRLHVCRVMCRCCGATHAILPSTIVPYSQIPLSIQVDIISAYEIGRSYSEIMEKTPSIDENSIHSLIRRYIRHWLQRILSAGLKTSASNCFIQLCFAHFSRQFMQIRPTSNILFLIPT